MIFNSIPFLVFLAVFMAVWPHVRRHDRPRVAFIALASAVFYGWWDWRFLLLIAGSGAIDFLAALQIRRDPRRRKLYLWTSVVANLGSLGFFKYLVFATDQLRWLLDLPATQWQWTDSLVLPVGISFYTFQSMSYTIDVYRGRLRPTRDPLLFFAYLSMFPQLVAGPIVRAADLLPQLRTPGGFDRDSRMDGLTLMTWGFFKKMVIADTLAPFVNEMFAASNHSQNALLWWLASVSFAIQIFADFSGYSDIARGIARWMGYRFPENFQQPYVSTSLREFWGRWHISLSTWFRDYLYIPLGGSRRSAMRNGINLLMTMTVSGLWHGANWTFIAWGGLHAGFMILERVLRLDRLQRHGAGAALGWGITMVAVLVGWVLFRAESIQQAGMIIRVMFTGNWSPADAWRSLDAHGSLGLLASAVATIIWWTGSRHPWMAWLRNRRPVRIVVVGTAIPLIVFLRGPGDVFIYFQF